MSLFTFLLSRSWTDIVLLALTLVILYIAGLSIYRLYFCPIARFPGPRLAALTLWYEFYFDVILSGRYQWKIREMHARYGPIVRITPFELHVDDPKFYDELYVGPGIRITDKYQRSIQGFGRDPAAFSTIPHAVHRMRRAALNPFFSKKSVNELMPVIQAKIDQLCARLEGFKGTGASVNMVHAYSAFTVDVITEYMFARSLDHLKASDFDPSWHEAIMTVSRMFNLAYQFPLTVTLTRLVPEWFVKAYIPSMSVLPELARLSSQNIEEVRKGNEDTFKKIGHRTIFHSLIYDSKLPLGEKTTVRLQAEGMSLVTAGSVTTAHFLTRATYELLSQPSKLSKLRAELQTVSSQSKESTNLSNLESLPYLNAIINETHRLTYGIPRRLMRVSPLEPILFKTEGHKTWKIPPGTPVGMSSLSLHDNPSIFPNPRTFLPERWLESGEKKREMEKALVPFSRGSRQCAGMNLAAAEICLTLYAIFGPEGVGAHMTLFETERERDVEIQRDWFNPAPREDSRGVRVLLSG